MRRGRDSRGEQAKPGGRRGKGAERSDGEKIDRWAVARHGFEDNELGPDFWQKYNRGQRFWVVRQADKMHYWAKKDSAEELPEAKVRQDELEFEPPAAAPNVAAAAAPNVEDLTGEDSERAHSSPSASQAAKRPRLCPGEQPDADAQAASPSPSAREVATGAGPQTGKGFVYGGGAHAGSLGVKRLADCQPAAAFRAEKGSKAAAKCTVEHPAPRRASAEEGARRVDAAHAPRANGGESVTFSSEHLAHVLCAALHTKVAMKALVRDVKAKGDAFRMVQQSSQAEGSYTNLQIAEAIAKCRPAHVSNASELLSWLVKVRHVGLACGCWTTVCGGKGFVENVVLVI